MSTHYLKTMFAYGVQMSSDSIEISEAKKQAAGIISNLKTVDFDADEKTLLAAFEIGYKFVRCGYMQEDCFDKFDLILSTFSGELNSDIKSNFIIEYNNSFNL